MRRNLALNKSMNEVDYKRKEIEAKLGQIEKGETKLASDNALLKEENLNLQKTLQALEADKSRLQSEMKLSAEQTENFQKELEKEKLEIEKNRAQLQSLSKLKEEAEA